MLGNRRLIALVVLLIVGFASASFAMDPVVVGHRFDAFCMTYFGVFKEPEMHRGLGQELKVPADGVWTYVSRNSAVIAWESSLPSRTYVHYGLTPNAYIFATPITTRNHFIHVHYLKNLQPNTTYHYRLVTMDERVRIVRSEERSEERRVGKECSC